MRIWVLWDPEKVIVEEIAKGKQYIHCKVTFLENKKEIEVTFLYAFNVDTEREELWSALIQLSENMQLPWVIMGDFNTNMMHEERCRGGEVVAENTEELASFAEQYPLTDLNFSGVHLTWCNKQEGSARAYAKLDRILVNPLWVQDLNWTNVFFLNPGISDHAPRMMCLRQQQCRKPKRFKFCNFWCNDPQFHALVREVWDEYVDGIAMFRIVQKLKKFK